MATRAHLREQITSDKIGALTPVALATVAVYQTGTTTPVTGTLYSTATGVGTLVNPLTADANGVVEFWMTNAQVVDLAITAAGYNAATVTAQVIGTDTATGILNLNTTTTPTAPGDVQINGENFTYEGAASLHTVGTLDRAQTYTGIKTFSSGVSADGTHTVTLPSATDTLVCKATTDILTNKTLTGNTLASFTPDGTHTLTAPAATDTLVCKATTDTLTNKSIDAGQLTGTVAGARLTGKELGAATATSAQSVTATATPGTDLTGLTVTCTPDGVHPVYVEFNLPEITETAAVAYIVAIQKDGAVVATFEAGGSTSVASVVSGRFREVPTNASHTYKLSAWSTGANTIVFTMAATQPALITVNQVQT